jgi:hypothetical protein
VTAPNVRVLAVQVRAELVGCGHVPAPVFDESATQAVRDVWPSGASEVYVAGRLTYVLRQLSRRVQQSGTVLDAQIALGEYETLLQLQRGAAA